MLYIHSIEGDSVGIRYKHSRIMVITGGEDSLFDHVFSHFRYNISV